VIKKERNAEKGSELRVGVKSPRRKERQPSGGGMA
jgi:hypothetical protein